MNIDVLLDHRPLYRLQKQVFSLIFAAILLEGFDLQLIAFAAPSILQEWNLERSELGPVMAAALLGMTLGAGLGGALGDRLGRRSMLVASMAFFAIATLLTAFAGSVAQVTWLRALAGLGFGAALPNATAYIAEWMPARLRGSTVALVVIGVPTGGMLGAALNAWLIPAFGWRAAFVVGGCLPILLCAAIWGGAPESLKFLIHKKRDPNLIARVANRLCASARFAASDARAFTVDEQRNAADGRLRDLLRPEVRRATFGLWLAFFANLAISNAMFAWIPTLLSSLGFAADVAIRGALYFNLFGVIGAIIASWLMVRAGSRPTMLALVAIGLAATIPMGIMLASPLATTTPSVFKVMLGLSAAGFANVGLQAALFALAAIAYPTNCRTSGVGYASGVGRVGALASTFFGGAIIALPAGATIFFVLLSSLLLLAALGVLIVKLQSDPRQVGKPQADRGM